MIRRIRGFGLALALCAASASAGDLAAVPGGRFRSVLPTGAEEGEVVVAPFRIDRDAVTNAEFAAFVREHPRWRRGRVPAVFADAGYLGHWSADGEPDPLVVGEPVTRVSWFAARAYCEARGLRLPRWYEWELTAAAGEHELDARSDPEWRQRILDAETRAAEGSAPHATPALPNAHGVRGLFGGIREWVDDFGALMVSADNREQSDPDKSKFCGSGALELREKEHYAVLMRIALLSSLRAADQTENLGFRCASAAEPEEAPAASGAEWDPRFPSDSLYQLGVALTDQAGRPVGLDAFVGHPTLVSLFYAGCPGVCPILVPSLQRVERELEEAARRGLRVLLVSLDPGRDTSPVLAEFAERHKLDLARWKLALASESDVRKIAALFGVSYRRLPNGEFNHASVITLVDPVGRVVTRTAKLGAVDPEFLARVRSAIGAAREPSAGGGRERGR